VVFAGTESPKSLNVYVAHVQDSFLDRLSYPNRDPLPNSGLDIYHWNVSAEPFQTLPQRLDWALRRTCSGKTHNAEDNDELQRMRGQKRKRDCDSNNATESHGR
jgi:hypothetical protein